MNKGLKKILVQMNEDNNKTIDGAIQMFLINEPKTFASIVYELDQKYKLKEIIISVEELIKIDVVRRVKRGKDIVYGLTPAEDYLKNSVGKIGKGEY